MNYLNKERVRYMNYRIESVYIEILRQELVAALGCTEPGAIAFSTSKVRELLGGRPDHIDIICSGNIIKNAKGVTVPNSGGMHGIEAAAILGALVSGAQDELEVLKSVTDRERSEASALIGSGYCNTSLEENESGFYLRVVATRDSDEAEVIIKNHHTNIIFMRLNDKTILDSKNKEDEENRGLTDLLNIKDIIEFADQVDIRKIKPIIKPQIEFNMAVAEEGMKEKYGAEVGRTILETNETNVKTKARAMAAAGSDARMGGCSLPVIVNSGSGNQGITLTVPVVVYAREMDLPDEKLYRALALSNLVAIHIKKYIGTLSAFCGAVTAGTAAGAAIMYLKGGDYEQIAATIINALGNLGGVICDGAKASCAAKISSSVEAGITACDMAIKGRSFPFSQGIVIDDVEKTIENVGHVAMDGMHITDIEILKIMLEDENRIRTN